MANPPGKSSERFLLVDDHAVVRAGLKMVLREFYPEAEFAEASSSAPALELAWNQKWSLILLDITMPGRSGLEVLEDLRRHAAGTPVLVLSAHPEEQFAIRALRAGAAGYLSKESHPEELLRAVGQILGGGRYITSTVAQQLVATLNNETAGEPHELLSAREFEVFRLLARGRQVKEIAADLSLSPKTVSTYRARIMEKMKMHGNSEMMRYAVQHLLVE